MPVSSRGQLHVLKNQNRVHSVAEFGVMPPRGSKNLAVTEHAGRVCRLSRQPTADRDIRSQKYASLFLCTAGIHSPLEPERLATLLNREGPMITRLDDEVIREALAAGCGDNMTIIGVEI